MKNLFKVSNIVSVETARKAQENAKIQWERKNAETIQLFINFLSQEIKEQLENKGRLFIHIPRSKGSKLARKFIMYAQQDIWDEEFALKAMNEICEAYQEAGYDAHKQVYYENNWCIRLKDEPAEDDDNNNTTDYCESCRCDTCEECMYGGGNKKPCLICCNEEECEGCRYEKA